MALKDYHLEDVATCTSLFYAICHLWLVANSSSKKMVVDLYHFLFALTIDPFGI